MDRDVAIRLDGMLIGARGNLDGIAHYMKNNLSPDEFSTLVRLVGKSMGNLIEISSFLHSKFSDITPKELLPEACSASAIGQCMWAPTSPPILCDC
jgi:hypothetical protein